MDVIELMKKELFRRNYSRRTIKTYLFCLRRFLKYCHKEPKKINNNDLKEYLFRLKSNGVSGSTLNVHLNALKFVMEHILGKKFVVNIRYSKTPNRVPIVLSQEEVFRLIWVIKNKKHNLMMKLMYGAGLRVSELVHLRVRDLELENNFGWVRKGKGDKDRLFIIAENINQKFQEYIRENNLGPDSWLFHGNKRRHLSQKSVYEIVRKSAKKAGIKKKVHPHTLRHSFSTHLIENGYDVSSVQSLLGHNSMETTMVYIHMANPRMISVKSPLDNLGDFDSEVGAEK